MEIDEKIVKRAKKAARYLEQNGYLIPARCSAKGIYQMYLGVLSGLPVFYLRDKQKKELKAAGYKQKNGGSYVFADSDKFLRHIKPLHILKKMIQSKLAHKGLPLWCANIDVDSDYYYLILHTLEPEIYFEKRKRKPIDREARALGGKQSKAIINLEQQEKAITQKIAAASLVTENLEKLITEWKSIFENTFDALKKFKGSREENEVVDSLTSLAQEQYELAPKSSQQYYTRKCATKKSLSKRVPEFTPPPLSEQTVTACEAKAAIQLVKEAVSDKQKDEDPEDLNIAPHHPPIYEDETESRVTPEIKKIIRLNTMLEAYIKKGAVLTRKQAVEFIESYWEFDQKTKTLKPVAGAEKLGAMTVPRKQLSLIISELSSNLYGSGQNIDMPTEKPDNLSSNEGFNVVLKLAVNKITPLDLVAVGNKLLDYYFENFKKNDAFKMTPTELRKTLTNIVNSLIKEAMEEIRPIKRSISTETEIGDKARIFVDDIFHTQSRLAELATHFLNFFVVYAEIAGNFYAAQGKLDYIDLTTAIAKKFRKNIRSINTENEARMESIFYKSLATLDKVRIPGADDIILTEAGIQSIQDENPKEAAKRKNEIAKQNAITSKMTVKQRVEYEAKKKAKSPRAAAIFGETNTTEEIITNLEGKLEDNDTIDERSNIREMDSFLESIEWLELGELILEACKCVELDTKKLIKTGRNMVMVLAAAQLSISKATSMVQEALTTKHFGAISRSLITTAYAKSIFYVYEVMTKLPNDPKGAYESFEKNKLVVLALKRLCNGKGLREDKGINIPAKGNSELVNEYCLLYEYSYRIAYHKHFARLEVEKVYEDGIEDLFAALQKNEDTLDSKIPHHFKQKPPSMDISDYIPAEFDMEKENKNTIIIVDRAFKPIKIHSALANPADLFSRGIGTMAYAGLKSITGKITELISAS